MNRKLYYSIISVVAIVCIVGVIIMAVYGSVFSLVGIAAFPLDSIGHGLRLLSLSGAAGNAVAVVIYIVLSLFPFAYYMLRRYRQKTHGEDFLLLLISASLFCVLYCMINPGVITKLLGSNVMIPMGKALLGGLWWSVLAAYAVLRILRLCFVADHTHLQQYFTVFLCLCAVVCAVNAFGFMLHDLYVRIAALLDANRGAEEGLLLTCIFLVLRYLSSILPYLLDIVVLESAVGLLILQRTEPDSAETVQAASRLAARCGKTLVITVLSTVCINLLQLLFADGLRDIHGAVSVPLVSIGIVMAVLLYARFVAENRQLRADNDRLRADNDLFI